MQYDEMVHVVLAALEPCTNEFDAHLLRQGSHRAAIDLGLYAGHRDSPHGWPHASEERVLYEEVVNDLIRDGVLGFAFATYQTDPSKATSRFRVSRYGREVVTGQPPRPYDQTGFIGALDDLVSGVSGGPLDETVLACVSEALLAFRHHCWRSAVVMVGICAERLAVMLEGSLVTTSRAVVAEAVARTVALGKPGLLAAKRIRLIEDVFSALQADSRISLPAHVKTAIEDIPVLLGSIRRVRNEHGHPEVVVASRETANMALQLFPQVCRHVYELIAWLGQPDE